MSNVKRLLLSRFRSLFFRFRSKRLQQHCVDASYGPQALASHEAVMPAMRRDGSH